MDTCKFSRQLFCVFENFHSKMLGGKAEDPLVVFRSGQLLCTAMLSALLREQLEQPVKMPERWQGPDVQGMWTLSRSQ